ncbi:MAG TPA: AMP-binding protein, partial [Allosphingosinicella sp.]|nr:AMP-binding protein [Allosphingosinicella sp.]
MASLAPERPQSEQARAAAFDTAGSLSRLLESAAQLEPDRIAFRDGPGREAWCGRPSFELNREIGSEAVRRLAAYLAALGLDPAARVGICLPNGSEAAMSILAVGEAGLTPCLLDVTATAGELSNAIETADIRAVITQARFGPERLAEKLCFIAAGFFRLRFLLAFGPNVPDGVVDLDPVLLEPRRSEPRRTLRGADPDEDGPGFVSFARHSGGRSAYFRTYKSLFAVAAPLLSAANIRPGERLLCLLPPDDLKGLTTGLAAGLLGQAAVEAHAVFDSALFKAALGGSEPTHLVAPGWMEPALATFDASDGWLSTILVHEPPVSFEGRPGLPTPVVDVICCSEQAL